MSEALSLPFFQRVLLAGLLASVACGVLGSFVVARRITSIAGGLSHAAFGGVGLGYAAGFSPMLGAVGFGVLAALGIGAAQRRVRAGLDTLVSIVWAVGMALGMAFVALAPGQAPDLMSYLFGSLLFVSWDYVALVAGLDAAVVLVVWLLFKELQAVCFDEEFAELAGVPVERVWLVLLALAALAIVTLIRVVGAILVIALLTLPAAMARHWASDLRRMMALAVTLSAACTAGGLFLAWGLADAWGVSLPPGPLIVLLAAAAYAASAGLRAGLSRRFTPA